MELMTCCYGTRKKSKIVTGKSIKDVENERISELKEFRKSKKSLKELKSKKYLVGELRLAGFSATECIDAGYEIPKKLLKTSKTFDYYTLFEIKNLGLSTKELFERKILSSPVEFHKLGESRQTISKLKFEPGALRAFEMKRKGASIEDCKRANLSAVNCRDGGYSASELYGYLEKKSSYAINNFVVCCNQKSLSEVPGATRGLFRKGYFFGNVIDTKTVNFIDTHRVEPDMLSKSFWAQSSYLRDQSIHGHLNNGFGPDRLLKWAKNDDDRDVEVGSI